MIARHLYDGWFQLKLKFKWMTKYKRLLQQQQRYRFMRLPVLKSVVNATYLNIQIKNPDIHIWHHIMLHWINLLYLSKSDRECSKSEFCSSWLLHYIHTYCMQLPIGGELGKKIPDSYIRINSLCLTKL